MIFYKHWGGKLIQISYKNGEKVWKKKNKTFALQKNILDKFLLQSLTLFKKNSEMSLLHTLSWLAIYNTTGYKKQNKFALNAKKLQTIIYNQVQ